MICSNCNRVIPDGSEFCPRCKSKINFAEKRCPNCWVRIENGQQHCHKCGCDIEKRIQEIHEDENAVKPTIKDRFNMLPKWMKIAIISLLIIAFVVMPSVSVYLNFYNKAKAVSLAEDYIISVDIALKRVTKLAQAYEDMVYGQSWLDHTGSADAVRKVYAEDIALIKRTRVPLQYTRSDIAKKDNARITEAVNLLYDSYAKCYNYVIGENGKYPGYMDEYNKLVKDYNKAVYELRTIIQEYK